MSKDFYDIIGVDKNASASEISKAYKKLAVKHHPDRGGDAEKMKALNEAYDTLKDVKKKEQYDLGGQNPYQQAPRGRQQGGFGNGFSGGHSFKSREEMEEFIKRHMHGGNPFGQWGQPSNEDIYVKTHVSLLDAYNCTSQNIQINIPGIGIETITFDIPKGVYNGVKIKLSNKGGQEHKDLPRSDLIVMIYIEQKPNIELHQHDIVMPAKINIIDIMTGTTHVIKHVDGEEISIKIPQGFAPYKELRVKGKGLWRNSKVRADLRIVIDLEIPKYKLTKKQLKTLEEIKNGK